MEKEESKKEFTFNVSDSFARTDEKYAYEPSFRRWLVKEIAENRITQSEAVKRFNFNPKNGHLLIISWQRRISSVIPIALPLMTEKEKYELDALQKRLKAMEKQLEESNMKNIALNILIDVAEEKLQIKIRKKPGAKQ
jgi:hypothetical protein